jgi:hypothetical protein
MWRISEGTAVTPSIDAASLGAGVEYLLNDNQHLRTDGLAVRLLPRR